MKANGRGANVSTNGPVHLERPQHGMAREHVSQGFRAAPPFLLAMRACPAPGPGLLLGGCGLAVPLTVGAAVLLTLDACPAGRSVVKERARPRAAGQDTAQA